MSTQKEIILQYKSIQKLIKPPETFSELQCNFLDLYNEDRNKVFSYFYYGEKMIFVL